MLKTRQTVEEIIRIKAVKVKSLKGSSKNSYSLRKRKIFENGHSSQPQAYQQDTSRIVRSDPNRKGMFAAEYGFLELP